MEELNEWDDILITLQLAYKENKTPDAIKTAARLILLPTTAPPACTFRAGSFPCCRRNSATACAQ